MRIVFRDRPVAVPEASEQPGEVIDVAEAAPSQKHWQSNYLRLRRLVMTEGVEAMPERAATPSADVETLRWRSGLQRTLEELL